MCFTFPSGVVALIMAAVIWRLRLVIEQVFHWAWMITMWLAITIACAVGAVVLGAALMVIWWTGCRIRRWQQARGACLSCNHPCTGDLGGHEVKVPLRQRIGLRIAGSAAPVAPSIEQTLTALPWPVVASEPETGKPAVRS